MKQVFLTLSLFVIASLSHSAMAQADSLADDNLLKELKNEAIENRAFFEQFVSPETFDKVLESLHEIDLNDLQEQLNSINLEEFFESVGGSEFLSPLLKNFSLENLNLNDLLNSPFFNPSPVSPKENNSEEGKTKI